MTKPTPIPSEAKALWSVEKFASFCNAKIPDFNPDQNEMMVVNEKNGDGKTDLFYQHGDEDRFCTATLYWGNHELELKAGSHTRSSWTPTQFLNATDHACADAHVLAGDEEFQKIVTLEGETATIECQDGPDPRLKDIAGKYPSLDELCEKANQLLAAHIKAKGYVNKEKITLDKFKIKNPEVRDGSFTLLYINRGQDFFLEIPITTQGKQLTQIRYGTLAQIADITQSNYSEQIEINGACTLVKDFLGEGELLTKDCRDYTATERHTQHNVENAFFLWMSADGLATFAHGGYKGYQAWRATSGIRSIGMGIKAFWGAKFSLTRWSINGIRTYVPQAARWSLTNIFRPIGARIATAAAGIGEIMLPQGLATFSAETATLSVGARLGWVGLSFTAGYGIGVGLNYLPKLVNELAPDTFSKNELCDYTAAGLTYVLGKPSEAMASVFEHADFFNYHVFYNRWKETLSSKDNFLKFYLETEKIKQSILNPFF